MFCCNKIRTPLIVAGVLLLSFTLRSAAQDRSAPQSVYKYHSIVPLGMENLRLQPTGQAVRLLATAECGNLEGIRRIGVLGNARLVAPNGSRLLYYPSEISFRLTASALKKADRDALIDVNADQDINSFLLNLHMRLKVFRGLDAYELEPEQAALIGVPAAVPYGERIYHAVFHLEQVPSDARIVLEVFDGSGQRISRFHLDLL